MLKTLSSLLSTVMFFAVIVIVIVITSLFEYSSMLPDYRQLAKYEPKVTTRLYAGDGQLLMEYASEKRFFVPINKIPERVKQAFIAAEDKNFYNHSGLDYQGIVRAALGNVVGLFAGKRPSGASTITQQVAKNFLLTPEVSYKRKIKEALLAFRIEDAFSKDHILELYLNEIYLGNRSYGVASAALNYFGKPLDELSIEEVAYLAALPKGPNNYHPKKHLERALTRRNWVIDRMTEEGYITAEEAATAKEKSLTTIDRNNEFVKDAQYFSEEVRRHVTKDFGEDALYEGGLIIRTTVDPKLQEIATKSFRNQLLAYDKRHGWRGTETKIDFNDEWQENFKKAELPKGAEDNWQKAVVTEVNDKSADIYISEEEKGQINLSSLSWARKPLKDQAIGAAPTKVSEVLNKGDVIYVTPAKNKGEYELQQVPNVEGGMIVMDPHTGKVLALVGGFDFSRSQFNRATQALRQTGSAFKPFVYLAALDNGYSPTDLILDAPFVLDQGEGLPKWKPKNYSTNFYGLTTLRQGIEKSRNLMTVRLAQDIGMKKVSEYAAKFGINNNLPELLSMSLGAGETHLIDMATGYSMIVNGGKRINPYFVEMIQDRNGKAIYRHYGDDCVDCNYLSWQNQSIPQLTDKREQIVDPLSAYQMTSIMEGVAIRGTAAKLRGLGYHLGGKTGTTNENKESWFVGFTPDMVVATYVGFDEPRILGRRETGATVALPVFYDFMHEALKGRADIPFRSPRGIKLVRVNYQNGRPATPQDKSVIVEALKPDFDFDTHKQKVIGENTSASDNENTAEADSSQNTVFRTEDNSGEFQMGSEY